MQRTAFLHAPIPPRAVTATPPRAGVRDPIPDALADTVWLGGEAMIAPACFMEPPVRDIEVDPDWLAI